MNKKLVITLSLIPMLIASCSIPESKGAEPENSFVQQTLDAMQLQNIEEPTQVSATPTTQRTPTPKLPTPISPTPEPPTPISPTPEPPTPKPPTLKSLIPTDTGIPFIPFIPQLVLTKVIEFDNQGTNEDVCNTSRQDMTSFGEGLWNENDQLFGAGYHNCSLGFSFSSDQSGTYRVSLYATYAPDFGELAIALLTGDTPTNTDAKYIDLYRPTVEPTGPIVLGNLPLAKGEKAEMLIFITGKNQLSTDYKFGLDYLKLECLNDC